MSGEDRGNLAVPGKQATYRLSWWTSHSSLAPEIGKCDNQLPIGCCQSPKLDPEQELHASLHKAETSHAYLTPPRTVPYLVDQYLSIRALISTKIKITSLKGPFLTARLIIQRTLFADQTNDVAEIANCMVLLFA